MTSNSVAADRLLSAIARTNAGAVAGTVPASCGEIYMDQLLYTIAQCCRILAIGRTKFYELVASGDIPVRKIGKKSLIAAADLRNLVERLPTTKTKYGDRGRLGGEATR